MTTRDNVPATADPVPSIEDYIDALTAYNALRAENERLREALSNIVTNAVIIPDPAMNGATDTYAVPLDDIDAARAALKDHQP